MSNTKKKQVAAKEVGAKPTTKKAANKPAKVIDLKAVTAAKLSDDTLVKVRSNCFGTLLWKSKDGFKTVWGKHGDEHDLSIRELREMKASSSRFFTDNWIIITGFAHGQEAADATPADIYKTLGVSKFYGGSVNPEGYADVHCWTEKDIRSNIASMTQGAKENLVIAVREHIALGAIDSIKTIKAFEDALGCEFAQPE
ncbi:MAG: hypothetical protein WC966_12325 [Bradymonadales bacterium]